MNRYAETGHLSNIIHVYGIAKALKLENTHLRTEHSANGAVLDFLKCYTVTMTTKRVYRGIVWIDLESPTMEEVRAVAKEYRLNPLVSHELSAPSLKPKVDLYDNFIYLILHFPRARMGRTVAALDGKTELDKEIDFVISKRFLITVRYTSSEAIHLFAKLFEAQAVLKKESFGPHAGFIFFHLLRRLYDGLLNELATVTDSLSQIENRIFRGEEHEMVLALSRISRDLLDFKRSLTLHREVLESFETAGQKMFGADFGFHLRALSGDYYRVEQALLSRAEFLNELRETNNSLVSTKQNEIMKILTIMAFVTFPLSLLAGIFGMNTKVLPIVGLPYDFWIIIAVMAVLTGIFFWYFKHNRWL
jgi:magnesium transporter